MARAEAPEGPTASAEAAAIVDVPPEIVAQSLGEWFRAWLVRLRAGQSGVLPVVLGLVLISIVFTAISPNNLFLSAGNLVNLFQQSAVFMVLAMAEIFVLLMGEIDLATGFTAGVGGVVAVQLVQPVTTKWPWWGAIAVALLVCALIGLLQGTLITRLRLSSLIVTLAGSLILSGVLLILLGLGPFSGYPSLLGRNPNILTLYKLMWGTIDPVLSWIGMALVVIAVGSFLWLGDSRHRRAALCLLPRRDVEQLQRWPDRPLRHRGRGHRRHEPLRRKGQDAARRPRRPGHRRHLQRHVPARHRRQVAVHRDRSGPARR